MVENDDNDQDAHIFFFNYKECSFECHNIGNLLVVIHFITIWLTDSKYVDVLPIAVSWGVKKNLRIC